ncbi:hypothetical protein [Rhizobium sp. CIAT894]|nr:hypothetical protein [Rhizobium sp. CIAT894]
MPHRLPIRRAAILYITSSKVEDAKEIVEKYGADRKEADKAGRRISA